MKSSFKYLFLILFWWQPNSGLTAPADDAWNHYLAGDFDGAVQLVYSSLSDTSLTSEERARFYFTLGCCYAMQGFDTPSADAFRMAFAQNPRLNYSTMELPPPVWKIFKSVQDSVQKAPPIVIKSSPQEIRLTKSPDTLRIKEYVFHPPAAVIRSIAYPGWGHVYEGDRQGYRYVIGETLLLAGFFYSLQKASKARESYNNVRSIDEVDSRYDTYNKYYKICWGIGAASAGLYLFAQWDLFSHPPMVTILPNSSSGIELGIHITL